MKQLLLGLLISLLSMQNSAFAYEMKSTTSSSYITVFEHSPDAFTIQYCKSGADHCVHLGSKTTYTLKELTNLKKSEQIKGGALAATAVATVLLSAWVGAIGGGIVGLKYLATTSAINTATSVGAASGAIISTSGISVMDKLNPVKRFQTAKTIAKMNSDEVDYHNDVDAQAMWLNVQLNKIK